MTTLLLSSGFELGFVLDLDMARFNAAVESVLRLKYRDKTEDAWTAMIAAQGEQKTMKKLVKAWTPVTGEHVDDQAEFLKRVGGGF